MLTVKDLYEACKKQIENGNGDKIVLVTNDEEANGYHALFYQFTDDANEIKQIYDYDMFDDCKPENALLIG